jgi:hypothetical protein
MAKNQIGGATLCAASGTTTLYTVPSGQTFYIYEFNFGPPTVVPGAAGNMQLEIDGQTIGGISLAGLLWTASYPKPLCCAATIKVASTFAAALTMLWGAIGELH